MKYEKIKPEGKLNLHTYLGDYGGCGYIRVILPSIMLNQFRYKKMIFESTYNTHFINDANFYLGLSLVKFQRACTQNHLNFIESCLEMSNKIGKGGVIYEIDDLLTPDIPDTNYSAKFYKDLWPTAEKIISSVHGVTVSTNKLREEFLKYNSNIRVIENRLSPFLWRQQKPIKNNNKKRILWAGSQNHFSVTKFGGDFNFELIEYIKKTCNKYQWVFVGAIPNELKDNTDIEFHKWQNILNFGEFLCSLKCDVGIAPLENNKFNDCKSNIKSLEFASLGIPGVYSGNPQYQNMKFSSFDNFIDNLDKMLNMSYLDRYSVWKKDYEKLKNNLYWDENSLKEYINNHLKLFGKEINDEI